MGGFGGDELGRHDGFSDLGWEDCEMNGLVARGAKERGRSGRGEDGSGETFLISIRAAFFGLVLRLYRMNQLLTIACGFVEGAAAEPALPTACRGLGNQTSRVLCVVDKRQP